MRMVIPPNTRWCCISTVPNALPSDDDPDGAGSLGMLGMLDPDFDGINSSAIIVYVDDPLTDIDDPSETQTLIYSEFPNAGHASAADWTTRPTYGVREWLFARAYPAPDIKANSSDEPVSIFEGDTLSVIIELDPGSYSWCTGRLVVCGRYTFRVVSL